jgi:hypothetical protein
VHLGVTQSTPLKRALLIVIALLGWLGIVRQLWVSARLSMHHGHSAWHGIVQARGFPGHPGTLAAAAVYIVVVGLIYALFLSALWAPTGLHQLADAILHSLIPVLYLLWWPLHAPKQGLPLSLHRPQEPRSRTGAAPYRAAARAGLGGLGIAAVTLARSCDARTGA